MDGVAARSRCDSIASQTASCQRGAPPGEM